MEIKLIEILTRMYYSSRDLDGGRGREGERVLTFSGLCAPGPGFLVASPGISFLLSILYWGAFLFTVFGSVEL